MQVTVAELRILVLEEQHSMDRAEGLAWARKADAFGTLTRLFARPRDEDFELTYKERRSSLLACGLQRPLWLSTGQARSPCAAELQSSPSRAPTPPERLRH